MFRQKGSVEEYLTFLNSKGFKLNDEAYGFIIFGQKYTGSSDYLVNIAIEITLKLQKQFDGSYFIGVLEALQANNIKSRKKALELFEAIKL